MSYSYVDADGNTIIPTHLTADAFLRDPSIIGYSYQAGTFTINDVSFTSDPYVMIKGDGSAVIRLFYTPDTYKLTLKLNDDVTFTDGNWIKSYSGAGNGFELTGSIDVTSGSQHFLPARVPRGVRATSSWAGTPPTPTWPRPVPPPCCATTTS